MASFAVFILVAAVAVILFLKYNAVKVDPHNKMPTPNSLSVPGQLRPQAYSVRVQA